MGDDFTRFVDDFWLFKVDIFRESSDKFLSTTVLIRCKILSNSLVDEWSFDSTGIIWGKRDSVLLTVVDNK